MFNLIVKADSWAESRDSFFDQKRIFEYTNLDVKGQFTVSGKPDFDKLKSLPTLFLEETRRNIEQTVKIGTITQAILSNGIFLEYVWDSAYPPITNDLLQKIALQLGIHEFEFKRTHWAVKDVDIFQVLFRNAQPRRQLPTVFKLIECEHKEPDLLSVMMPYAPTFDKVYAKLKQTADKAEYRCQRADDIWEHSAIMQDVVTLIDKSSVVICDCTGRNPNVFYEIGIAHTLGREVILITQSKEDIPFDLQHLRYILYQNTLEGLEELLNRLLSRLNQL